MPEQLADGQGSNDPHGAGPVAAPAFALVGPDGAIWEATAPFMTYVGADVMEVPGVLGGTNEITKGTQDLAVLRLEGLDGETLEARAEAVLDPSDRRFALMEVMLPRPPAGLSAAAGWLARFVELVGAIVWLKDLDGRYVYVNAAYTRALGAKSSDVEGRTDAELTAALAIDAPRSRGRSTAEEPTQLEYTIPAFDRRPAFAALRFPLYEPDGRPFGVCGVASPADHAEIGQRETARLLDVARWYRGDAAELRRDALRDWGMRALHAQGAIELLVEEDERVASAELAEAVERAEAAEAASLQLEQRVRDLQREVAAHHQRAQDAEGSLTDARGRADVLAASLETSNVRLGRMEEAWTRIRELESMVATAGAAGVAAAESARRVTELEAQMRRLNSLLEEERFNAGQARTAATEARDSAQSATASLTAERDDLQARNQELEAGLGDALRRLASTEQGAGEASGRAAGFEARASEADRRAADAETRAADAETRAADAETRAAEAEARAAETDRRAAELDRRAADAEERAADAERRAGGLADQAGDVAHDAERLEAQVREADGRALAAEVRAAAFEERVLEAERNAAALEQRAQAAEQSRGQLLAALATAEARITELEEAAAARAATPAPPAPEPVTPAPATLRPLVSAPPDPLPVTAVHAASTSSTPQAPSPSPQVGWTPAAQAALGAGLRAPTSLRSILAEAVRLVGSGGGWDIAVAWTLDPREGSFGCVATWVRAPVEMARLETSMWQVRQKPGASAIGAAANGDAIIWDSNPGADGDRHLAAVRGDGMRTVVLLPIREGEQALAVLELCTSHQVQESAAATMALRSIAAEISTAGRRVIDAEKAAIWQRRRR